MSHPDNPEIAGTNRREFLKGVGATAGAALLGGLLPERLLASPLALGGRLVTAPVSIARCETYELATVLKNLETILDQTGGLKKLVAGKTVAVKVNMVNTPADKAAGLPSNRTYQVHPNVARALAILLDKAGAKRVRFLESTFSLDPVEKFFTSGGWNLRDFDTLGAKVEFEDTRNKGLGKQYHRVKVPWGGSLYPAYELNHSYVDCDVYLSVAKMKNHRAAGVTLSMKNNFGITPTALYGHTEPSENNISNRGTMFHTGEEKPHAGLPQEVDPASPRKTTYRVPRHVVDAVGIRPIDLAIIDGIETVAGGEGPWHQGLVAHQPHLLLAGRNCVCTDSIATACMGYNPMAKSGTETFPGDNHLTIAAALGLGTNNPKDIEVLGLPLKEALHPYKWEPNERNY